MTTAVKVKKLNFFVDEDVRKEMEVLVPAGRRSSVINEALRRELLRLKRLRVTEKLDDLRSAGKRVPEREIVAVLRKDRKRA